MFNASDIREHSEVIGKDGQHVGTVDRVEGSRIKLTKADSQGAAHAGHHHFIALDLVEVDAEADAALPGVRIRARTRATARTGVEMEALAAVMAACLTVYDMVKAVDRGMTIEGVRLLSKTGGTRGDWSAPSRNS